MQSLFVLSFCAAISFGAPDNVLNVKSDNLEKNDSDSLSGPEGRKLRLMQTDTSLLGCKFISKRVNRATSLLWEASSNLKTSTSPELSIRSSYLNMEDKEKPIPLDHYESLEDIASRSARVSMPQYYDARLKHHYCPSLQQIEDQGCGCRGSWAVAPVSALTDRFCIRFKGKFRVKLSAEQVLTCCAYCSQGEGCEGGYSIWAWVFLRYTGTYVGGPYDSNEGCQNYGIVPCRGRSPFSVAATPKCNRTCEDGSDPDFIYHSSKSYFHKNTTVAAIQRDILENGPVTTDMNIFEDFFCYKSGVYKHILGDQISVQTVKLIGWGHADGVDYWIAANSWGTEWGEEGFFRIQRGTNECNIEYMITAGLPKNPLM